MPLEYTTAETFVETFVLETVVTVLSTYRTWLSCHALTWSGTLTLDVGHTIPP